MKLVRICVVLLLLAALVVAVQLGDPPPDTPARQFARLPEINLLAAAESAPMPAALLVADYIIANDLPQRVPALALRQQLLVPASSAQVRLQTAGWSSWAATGNAYDNLAGKSLADALQYGDLAPISRELLASPTEFDAALEKLRPLSGVFPPANTALSLAQLGRRTGALNDALAAHLQSLAAATVEPTAAVAIEQFRQQFMPLFELARRCRTWSEWQTILQQADSPDQVRVLTKIVSSTPVAAKQLSQILAVATRAGRPVAVGALDYLLRQGPAGLDQLQASLRKGAAGLELVMAHPELTVAELASRPPAPGGWLEQWRNRYQQWRYEQGALVPAVKYLLIALLAGLAVWLAIPPAYFSRLMPSENGRISTAHAMLSALAVGVLLSGLAYLMARGAVEPVTAAAGGAGGGPTVPGLPESRSNPWLSGGVVMLSLLTHAAVWFWVRGKLKLLEDDDQSPAPLRLKRLENLDVFLDLPLFTGLALTVIAFILITLDAGMSRHFAYTSTVVGILSAVSLRIRYQYPLKERLLGS